MIADRLWVKREIARKVVPPGGAYDETESWHAQGVCLIIPRSVEESEKKKWGFNRLALHQEMDARLKQFLEALQLSLYKDEIGNPHLAREMTLALRCFHANPAAPLTLSLLIKQTASTKEEAAQAVKEICSLIEATFPRDYTLKPAENEPTFNQYAGWDLLQTPESIFEITRYEDIVAEGNSPGEEGPSEAAFYYQDAWQFSVFADEQIWRILAGAQQPILLEILFTPTLLTLDEVGFLNLYHSRAGKVAEETAHLVIKTYAEQATANLEALAKSVRSIFKARVRVVAGADISPLLPEAIGAAYVYNEQHEMMVARYAIQHSDTPEKLDRWAASMRWLLWDKPMTIIRNKNFPRICQLVTIKEMQALFRLPVLPEDGQAGVSFLEE